MVKSIVDLLKKGKWRNNEVPFENVLPFDLFSILPYKQAYIKNKSWVIKKKSDRQKGTLTFLKIYSEKNSIIIYLDAPLSRNADGSASLKTQSTSLLFTTDSESKLQNLGKTAHSDFKSKK